MTDWLLKLCDYGIELNIRFDPGRGYRIYAYKDVSGMRRATDVTISTYSLSNIVDEKLVWEWAYEKILHDFGIKDNRRLDPWK